MVAMTKLMDEAIDALHDLPEDRQEMLARAILDYAAHIGEVYRLSDDERAAIQEGLSSPAVADEKVQAFRKRHTA
jgi:hypothetical protein